MRENIIGLVATDDRLVQGWFTGEWWICTKGVAWPTRHYPTLCAAWNALHLAYAERELA